MVENKNAGVENTPASSKKVLIAGSFFVVFMAIINRLRGGGIPRINQFMQDKFNIKIGRSLWIATILVYFLNVSVFNLVNDEFNLSLNIWLDSFWITLGFLAWAISGWGSYFDIGITEADYKDSVEIGWIDNLLYLVFGPKVSPVDTYVRNKWSWKWSESFSVFPITLGLVPPDVVLQSETIPLRDYKWRRNRDLFGMFLRMCHSIYMFLAYSIIFDNYWILLLTLLFSVVSTLGYWFSKSYYHYKIWPKISSKFTNPEDPSVTGWKRYLALYPDSGTVSELFAGLSMAACQLVAIVIGVYFV